MTKASSTDAAVPAAGGEHTREPARQKRLLVHLRHVGVVRPYADVLARLGKAGVRIEVYAENMDRGAVEETVAALIAGDVPGVTVHRDTSRPSRTEQDFVLRLRWLCDVLRYQHPSFEESKWLRDRALEYAPPGVARWARRLSRGGWGLSAVAIRAASALDRILPPPPRYARFLDDTRPDLVIAAPVVWPGSAQVELLKAASRRGIPTAVLIPSWDNLTNKGLIRFVPDRVFVWNEMQQAELESMHGIGREHSSATGAPTFDRWFEFHGRGREEFCERVGLDPSRPYVLYLASSRLVAPDEPTYFERWLAHIRSAENPLVQRVQVLVRPHPLPPVFAAWVAREISRHNDVVLFPDDLQEALTSPDYHSDYADSMRHCAVAVGLNSSSMVEVAIFGKAVLTWEDGPFGVRQQQTLHYHHLLEAGGGLLHVATNAADHLEQLDRYLREAATGAPNERSAAFVRAFVRPRGLDRLVAPLMAEEIADLLDAPTQVAAPGPAARAVGERLKGLSFLLGLPLRDKPARSVCVRSTASAIFAWLQLTEALDTRRQQAVLDLDRLGTVGRKRLQKGATRSSKRANRLTRLSRKRLQKWSTQTNRRITQTDKRIAHINKRARKKLPKLARRYRKRAARVLRHTRLAPGKVASRRIIHRSRRALKRILSRNPRATRLARRVLRGLGYSKKTQA